MVESIESDGERSRSGIDKGRDEARAGARPEDVVKVRRSSGKRPFEVAHPTVWPALERFIDPVTRGDPESPLRWTSKSTQVLSAELFAHASIVTRGFAVRFLSLLFGLLAVLCAYAAARYVIDDPWLACAVGVLVALPPTAPQQTASVNNDAAAIGVGALVFYLQLRVLARYHFIRASSSHFSDLMLHGIPFHGSTSVVPTNGRAVADRRRCMALPQW